MRTLIGIVIAVAIVACTIAAVVDGAAVGTARRDLRAIAGATASELARSAADPPRRSAVASGESSTLATAAPIPLCLCVFVKNADGSVAPGEGVRVARADIPSGIAATVITSRVDGRAIFSKADLELVTTGAGSETSYTVTVRNRRLLGKPVTLARDELLEKVVTLTVDAAAEVDVEVYSGGERLKNTAHVSLVMLGGGSHERDRSVKEIDRRYTTNGVAHFSNVEPGIDVGASVEWDGAASDPAAAPRARTETGRTTTLRVDVRPAPR